MISTISANVQLGDAVWARDTSIGQERVKGEVKMGHFGRSGRRRASALVTGAAGVVAFAAAAWACTEPLNGPFVVTGPGGAPSGARGATGTATGVLVQDEVQEFGTCDLLDGGSLDTTACSVSLYWMEATDPATNVTGALPHPPHPCHHGSIGSFTPAGTYMTTATGAADGMTGQYSFNFTLPSPLGSGAKLIWFCATGAGANSNASMSNSLAPFLIT